MTELDPVRLAAVISPLRRNLLSAARAAAHLPDIPDAQIEVIRTLPRDGALSSGALAQRLGLNPSTISNLLRAMSIAGLIDRRRGQDDRRRTDVRLTARAVRLFDRFDDVAARTVAHAATALSPTDRATLAAALPALEALSAAIANDRHDAKPASSSPTARKEAE